MSFKNVILGGLAILASSTAPAAEIVEISDETLSVLNVMAFCGAQLQQIQQGGYLFIDGSVVRNANSTQSVEFYTFKLFSQRLESKKLEVEVRKVETPKPRITCVLE